MIPISGLIIARNEGTRIAAAIASLSWCEEVLVVDGGSADDTIEIAKRSGARVITRVWDNYSRQKNFGAEHARYDWIFSLDADERVSAELAEEIVHWKANGTSPGSASMPRLTYYLGSWIHHSGWRPDRKIRLYDRRFACWEGDYVHESLKVTGPIRPLAGDILHFPYASWSDHLARIDRYTRLAAASAKAQGRAGSSVRLLCSPAGAFLRTMVLRGGFLDGWRGAAIAYAAARYVFQRELRILR